MIQEKHASIRYATDLSNVNYWVNSEYDGQPQAPAELSILLLKKASRLKVTHTVTGCERRELNINE